MKKRIFRILAVVLLVCFGMTAIMACNPEKEPEPDATDYTVTYVGGEGATGEAPAAETHKAGENFKLKANPFTKKGFAFTKWNDGTNNYSAGATYKMPAKNVVFTAQWEEAEMVTVTYSLGEYTTGTAPTANTVEKGGEVTLADAPAWEGYDFLGWRVGTDLKNAGDKITVTANITVTAEWEKHTPPMDGTWTASDVDGALFGADGKVSLEVAVKKEGLGVYAVLRITGGDVVHTTGILFDGATEGWAFRNITLKIAEDGSKLTVGGLGQTQDKAVDLTGRTEFTGDEYALEGAYTTTVDEKTVYVDFSYGAIDRGEGLLEDAEFVSVGKYVITFVEMTSGEDVYLTGLYVFEAEGESVVSYSQGPKLTFTATTARAQKISFTSLVLEEDEGKVYLIGSGTYEGYTASDMLALMEGHDDDQVQIETESGGKTGGGFNLSFYCAGHRDYEADWTNVENTAKGGLFTAKLDVTGLNIESYLLLANNSGYGDLKFPADTDERAVLGDKVYTLKGSAGAFAYLVVGDSTTDWTGITAEVTTFGLALNTEGDKVIFTISGTYEGCTAESFKSHLDGVYQNDLPLFYFWGPTASTEKDPNAVSKANADGTWSVEFDVTSFKDDAGRAICTSINGTTGLNKRDGTEFQLKGITDTTVELGEKAYTLTQAGGSYGHTTLAIGAPKTLTYSLGDWEEGAVPASFKAAAGSKIVLAEAPERDGYLFKGWKTGVNDKGDVIQQPGERVELKSDLTVTAVYVEAVTVTYSLGTYAEGKAPDPVVVEKDSKVKLPAAPEWEGSTFLGWKVGEEAELKQGGAEITVTADVTVTAQWQRGSLTGIWKNEAEKVELLIKVGDSRAYVIERVEVKGAQQLIGLLFTLDNGAYKCNMGETELTLTLEEGVLTLSGSGEGQSLTFDAIGNLPADIEVSGAYSYKPDPDGDTEYYFDTAYGAIDMAQGSLSDAEFVVVGNYLVGYVKQSIDEDTEITIGMYVLEAGEAGALVFNSEMMEDSMTFTATTARVKNVVVTSVTVGKEGTDDEEKMYLTMEGTYTGFKTSEVIALSDDDEVAIINFSIFQGNSPYTTYPTPSKPETHYVNRVYTIGEGEISAKFDINTLPLDSYRVAPRNDGVSDVKWGTNTAQDIVLGERRYALTNIGGNVTLIISSSHSVVATGVTLGLDSADSPTKVLLTITGTYEGFTKQEVEQIFTETSGLISFWGSRGQSASYTTSVENNGKWTIVVDITNLEDDNDMAIIAGYWGAGKLNDTNNGTEFHFSWVENASVTFNNKVYTLKKTGGAYGHNCVSVKPAE